MGFVQLILSTYFYLIFDFTTNRWIFAANQSLHSLPNAPIRVLLLSTVHQPNDPRIAGKIAPVLAEKYEVFRPTFSIIKQLIWRLVRLQPLVLWHFLRFRPHIVHIFVPELLPLAFVFRWLGAVVIYEVQENLYQKFPTKTYNRGWLLEQLFAFFDRRARRCFYFIFTEEGYLKEYQNLMHAHEIVHNFADLKWTKTPLPQPTGFDFFYAGVISTNRALDTMLAAIALVSTQYPAVRLHLFGQVSWPLNNLPHYFETKENLVFYGYQTQETAFRQAQNCRAGLALLKPVGDYLDSYPSKLFDYMALGLPVVVSDFPLYAAMPNFEKYGFRCSPHDAQQLSEILIWLIEHPEEAQEMGKKGREAVENQYNWPAEAQKMLDLYEKLSRLQQQKSE